MNALKGPRILIVILYLLCLLLFVTGFYCGYRAITDKDYTLLLSCSGLLASAGSTFISSILLERKYNEDRPFLVLKANERRYSIIQLEFVNVTNSTAVITNISVEEDLYTLDNSDISKQIQGAIIQGNDSVAFPYIVVGNPSMDHKYKTIRGIVHYKDTAGNNYKNEIMLNLGVLHKSLSYKDESLKRDYEITKFREEFSKINKNLDDIVKFLETKKQ